MDIAEFKNRYLILYNICTWRGMKDAHIRLDRKDKAMNGRTETVG